MQTKDISNPSVQQRYPAMKFAFDQVSKEIGTLQVIFGTPEEYDADFQVDVEDSVAFYDGKRFYINSDLVDVNDKEQATSILAHEVGHILYSPMDKQIQAIEFVIAQKAIGCGKILRVRTGTSTYTTPDLCNFIDDEIVNLSVINFSNPEVSKIMREWIKKGAPIKIGETYRKTGELLWDFHVDVMMDFVNKGKYRNKYLKILVQKGKGLNNPEEYFLNYKKYAEFIVREVA